MVVVWGAAGSLVAALILFVAGFAYRQQLLPTRRRLVVMHRLGVNRIINVRFARSHHTESKEDLLRTATRSIEMIAFSLRGTEVRSLCEIFGELLVAHRDFEVHVSLLHPDSAELLFVAGSYELSAETVWADIGTAREELLRFRTSLRRDQQAAVTLSLHRCPIGTAILIDCRHVTPRSRIQTEFKLYDVAREFSFGYDVTAPSPVFDYNHQSWRSLLAEAETYWASK